MDAKKCERAADRIVDTFSDMRISEGDIMYVAMFTVIKAQPIEILERVVEFGEQVKWEINNRRQNREYEEDGLF